ncbi:beta-1,4-mannosyltransferase [Rhodococcus sp. 27YEA15]|uniref:glycosyltransferase n=1 Tax=Rhodococcus sp. 27YEA15 TaxID=3156259 RepID=UPI003C7D98CB
MRPRIGTDESQLQVMLSVRGPHKTTNPYVVKLADSIRDHGVSVRYFNWNTALFGRYDLIHIHWPEVMIRRDGALAQAAARARFAMLMTRLQFTKTPIVRTAHNVRAHESGSRIEGILLRWCDRRTRTWIVLNESSAVPSGRDRVLIPHGDYVEWFTGYPKAASVPGRIVSFGLIRPYKGTEVLLESFAHVASGDASLRIVGKPSTDELRTVVESAAGRDSRISAVLEYVDDSTLALEITAAQLVVLPYQNMHNSGALLLALSLERPVLVPDTAITRALADEVGAGWVHLYAGALTATALEVALAAPAPARSPDLSARAWPRLALAHIDAYRDAVGRADLERVDQRRPS